MPRYIEESEAIECIKFGVQFGFNPVQCIQHTPTADVAPVVHGEWIIDKEQFKAKCSVCGNTLNYTDDMQIPLIMSNENYCYSCGADMRKVTT